MTAPDQLHQLVDRFDYNLTDYKQGKYNETQVRREFIDPFLKLLGWDVDNEKGYAEAYKEVVHEDAVKVGGATKAPDYSFRIGGVRKFFLEAKKPSVNIKHDTHPAYQLRRYAWSAKLPLSILTDFEEFAVYDGRVKPDQRDGAATARVKYITYRDYLDNWPELIETFSPEAIRRGAFDKYVESSHKKRGTAEVDSAFLQEIERWRETLARNLALRNPSLSQRQLNFAVQQTIDRIIFLRIAEDRGIEPYGQLMALQNGSNIYDRLQILFRRADDRYNAGLFHFKAETGRGGSPDTLTPELRLDDKTLQDVFKHLYYPDSPYEFSVLGADILGQVYEQFLGKVIRLTQGHRAVVEDKPEVKKAGGVFYTPTYIVDYIVAQTVGRLVAGRTPDQISGRGRSKGQPPLRLVDPACGSGSFLLGAYQFLLDWYRDWYTANEPDKWTKTRPPRIYEAGQSLSPQPATPNYQLTIDERKQILLTHIFGVDIDLQAVEVTKLSLLLKVLEDEKSVAPQLEMFQQRVLPDLGANIKCGNSLIGPDFYATHPTQMSMFDEDELYRINAFDWAAEFPIIFRDGGFDAVIGNPPYVRQELLKEFKYYFQKTYQVYHGMADLYAYFIEKGMLLLKFDGIFSFIVANKWMRAKYGKPLRRWIKNQHIVEIIDFGDLPVFERATTYPCIIILKNTQPNSHFYATDVKTLDFDDLKKYVNENYYNVQQMELGDESWTLVSEQIQKLLLKIARVGVLLPEYLGEKIYYGIKTGLNRAFVIDRQTYQNLIYSDSNSIKLIKPFLAGRDVKRYTPPNPERFLILIPNGWTRINSKNSANPWKWFKENYPAIANYLQDFETAAKNRYDQGEFWWELRSCEYYEKFDNPKIIIPTIVKNASYTFDQSGFYSNDKTSIIASSNFYLLGVLNSKLADFYIHSISSTKRGGYYEYKPMYLEQLPIRTIDFDDPADKAKHDQLVSLVEQMLALHRQLAEAQIPQAKTMLNRQIAAVDSQIDRLVYGLYNLSPEEIEIVEASGKS